MVRWRQKLIRSVQQQQCPVFKRHAGGIPVEQQRLEVTLAVEDTGEGIPPDDLPHIFDRFYRAGEHSRDATGTGLGLAIVKALVTAHRGDIQAESTPGEGTVFTIRLPRAEDRVEEQSTA